MRHHRSTVLLIIVFVGAGILVVGAADTAAAEDSDIKYADVADAGDRFGDSPPGVRSDGQRLWWAEHWPADSLFADPGDPTDDNAEFVGPDTEIDRPEVWLSTVSQQSITHEITVVYWSETEETVVDPETNETVTQPAAEVHRVDDQQITFEAGMPTEPVDLNPDLDDVQVTMWVEGQEDDLRWSFSYDPVETAQPIAIQTVGDFWSTAFWWLILPFLVGAPIGGFVSKKAIERTGMGPGYPLWLWFTSLAIVGTLVIIWQFSSIAELIEALPYVVGVGMLAISMLVGLESQAVAKRKVAFTRPHVRSAESPNDDDAVDVVGEDTERHTVVDLPDGSTAVVTRGLTPFLARLFGSAAALPRSALQTTIDVEGDIEQRIIVDPESPEVLQYEQEGFAFDPPHWKRLVKLAVLPALVVVAIGTWVSWGWATITAIPLAAAIVLRPTDGSVEITPASVHVRSAWVSNMTLARDYDDAKSLEEARERLVELQSEGEQKVQEALEDQDQTMIEEMLGQQPDRSNTPPENPVGVSYDDSDSPLQQLQEMIDDLDQEVHPSDD